MSNIYLASGDFVPTSWIAETNLLAHLEFTYRLVGPVFQSEMVLENEGQYDK